MRRCRPITPYSILQLSLDKQAIHTQHICIVYIGFIGFLRNYSLFSLGNKGSQKRSKPEMSPQNENTRAAELI